MKNRILSTALLALAVAATSAFGQAGMEKKVVKRVTAGKGLHAQKAPCLLDLTEDQRTKIDAMKLEADKAVLPLQAQIEIKSAELKQLMLADKPAAAAIEKKIDEIGGLKTQIQKKRTLHQVAVRGLLTPDQRVDFDRKTLGRRHGMGFGPMGSEGRDMLMRRGGEGPMKRMMLQRHVMDCPEGPCGEPDGEVEIEIETK
ncbi:periplasmic heavy metal sensor [bacterium]|nr:periplasmic heavy metal sensor [bacterium]